MLSNDNSSMAFNDFSEMPQFPYRIIEAMLMDNSIQVENFWKLLKYSTIDCLNNPNLTLKEKKDLIWTGQTMENNYSVFLKPLVGSSTDSAESQTQLRLFRYNTSPSTQLEAIICFEADFITNEKTCLVYDENGILVEKTDLMESYFLNFMNGRDIKIGSGYFTFNRELSRSCNSQLSISNSKSFFGRSLVMGLLYMNCAQGGAC